MVNAFVKYIFLTFYFVIFFLNSYSQEVKLASKEYPELRYYPLRGSVYTNTYIQIKGDAYLTDDWITGNLYLTYDRTISNVKFKYDNYGQFVVVYNDKLHRLVLPEHNLITAFSYKDGGVNRYFKRVNSDFGVKKVHSDYFLEVLHEGNISFYKLFLKSTLPLRIPEMPFIDEFISEERYYIYLNGNYEIVHLKKSFLKQPLLFSR